MKFLYYLILSVILFFPKDNHAQLYDDFSDGNLSDNVLWNGDTANFIVQNERLRSNALEAGHSRIFTQIELDESENFEWKFELELDFPPSNNNNLRVILYSSDNLFWNLDGQSDALIYYLKFGENGSSDAVELYRIDSSLTEEILICRGVDELISSSFHYKYKVTYQNAHWEIKSANFDSPYYNSETSGIDTIPHFQSGYFGLDLNYTISNVDAFFFDDISFDHFIPDTENVFIDSVIVVSQNQLLISFSEAVDSAALNPENYMIMESLQLPVQVDFLNSYQDVLLLGFELDFDAWLYFDLQINSIVDIAGNESNDLEISFIYTPKYLAQVGDLRINEIMPDPSPEVGLPNAEFIELLNVSDSIIDVDSYMILNSGNSLLLPAFSLKPDSFLIVCKQSDIDLFESYGQVLALQSWYALLNSGDSIVLLNKDGAILDHVYYKEDWYDDALKKEGGWSLERIDPESACKGRSNWNESISDVGGSPGAINSVNDLEIDNEVFYKMVYPIDSNTIVVNIEGELERELQAITLQSDPLIEFDLQNSNINNSGLIIHTTTKIEKGIIYLLNINNLKSCQGEIIPSKDLLFGFPEIAQINDVVINEILFNALTGAHDFVEIYNRSSHFIDLMNWRIVETENGIPVEDARITDKPLLIGPKEILAFSEDVEEIPVLYSNYKISQLIRVSDLPNFADDRAGILLLNQDFEIIDSLEYSSEMHFSLLDDLNGVSLERVDPDRPGLERSNWVSASESAGFATPGLINSHYRKNQISSSDLSIEPQLFTPNNDGYNDVLYIQFDLGEGGWEANINIYNDRGILVKKLLSNQWIENRGVVAWNGLNNKDELANVGIYIVYFEAFNSKGEKEVFKKACVLAKEL